MTTTRLAWLGAMDHGLGMTIIGEEKVVCLEYVLTDKAGKELDRSKEEPLRYLHGARNIVPGLERQLLGKTVGDELDVVVSPTEGYGPKQKVKPLRMPRSKFPKGMDLKSGMSFTTKAQDGRAFPLWVLKTQGNTIVCTPQHPLAGVELHFHVKVTEVRDATDEEKQHGHAHGPKGHEHD